MDRINQNKFSRWLIIVLLAVNLLTVSIIWMQNMQKREPLPPDAAKPGQTVKVMQNTIGLTDQQAGQFAIMREEHFDRRRKVEMEIASLKKQLYEEEFGDEKDTARINGLLNQIGAKQTEIEKLQIEHFEKLADICSKEQKEKLSKLLIETVGMPRPMAREGAPPLPLHERNGGPPPPRH